MSTDDPVFFVYVSSSAIENRLWKNEARSVRVTRPQFQMKVGWTTTSSVSLLPHFLVSCRQCGVLNRRVHHLQEENVRVAGVHRRRGGGRHRD